MTENISIYDRLADRLKNSEVGALLSEADLVPISRQIIEKAFITEKNRWGQFEGSPLVKIIHEQMKETVAIEVKKIVEEMSSTPEFRKEVVEILLLSLPNVLSHSMRDGQAMNFYQMGADAVQAMRVRLTNG